MLSLVLDRLKIYRAGVSMLWVENVISLSSSPFHLSTTAHWRTSSGEKETSRECFTNIQWKRYIAIANANSIERAPVLIMNDQRSIIKGTMSYACLFTWEHTDEFWASRDLTQCKIVTHEENWYLFIVCKSQFDVRHDICLPVRMNCMCHKKDFHLDSFFVKKTRKVWIIQLLIGTETHVRRSICLGRTTGLSDACCSYVREKILISESTASCTWLTRGECVISRCPTTVQHLIGADATRLNRIYAGGEAHISCSIRFCRYVTYSGVP